MRTLASFHSKNLIIGAFILSFPLLTHASLLTFVENFLNHGAGTKMIPNSQSMALLEAPVNIDPSPNTGGGDITVVGGTALVSDNGPSGGLVANTNNIPSSDRISLYIVRQGDTLSAIAKLFGVSINTIRWNNDIKGSTISPGQTLTILPVSGVQHVVKKGDTIKSIAKLYKGDVAEIEQYNNIATDSQLSVGDVIIVPDGEIIPAVSHGFVPARTQFASSPQVSADGYFIRPTSGPETQGIHGYNAVDIAPPYGTPIVAAATGKIIVGRFGGWNGGYGSYVVIQHDNGTQTLYAHMSKEAVSEGSEVVQGQVIGYVGASGKATGPHLHFEIRGAKNPF